MDRELLLVNDKTLTSELLVPNPEFELDEGAEFGAGLQSVGDGKSASLHATSVPHSSGVEEPEETVEAEE